MFGQGIIGSTHNVPQWIMDTVDEVERSWDICLSAVYFKEPTRNPEYRGACYIPSYKSIDLYFGREKTDLRLWIVLHEMVHAIQYLELSNTLTKTARGKRRVVHNETFWEIAARLYIKYNVIEMAIEQEYKRGRKHLKKWQKKLQK